MSCERYREALADVAAGGPVPAGVEAHLAACEACRAELGTLRQALAMADGELAGLRSAEPSPEMVVRIRQAVADSDEAPAWRFGWLWPAVAVAATLAVALAVWPGRGAQPGAPIASDIRPERPAPVLPTVPPEAPREGSSTPTVVPQPVPEGSAGPASPSSSRRPRVPRDEVLPEVLVPAGEAEAFLRFAAHLQTRVVSPDSLLVADLSAPLREPKDVEIRPLEIVPLDPAEASGTD
jgi:hypothetical protein